MKTAKHAGADAAALETPYLSARREWNERYGDYIARARSWRWAAFAALALSLVLAIGVVWQGAQSKVVPYVVEVDKLGDAVAVKRADRAASPNQSIVRAQLAAWIGDARSVSSDPQNERNVLTRVYSFIGVAAKPYLDDWYRTHSPFEAGTRETVAVSIDAVLPQTATTYQVQWTEVRRSLDGTRSSTTHWIAQLTVGFNPPADEATILRNPMGIYVTGLSWTQQL